MKALLALLLLAAPPAHACGHVHPLVGADLSTRGIGAAVTLLRLNRDGDPWYGASVGGQLSGESGDGQAAIAAQTGFAVLGIEAGLTLGRTGLRQRLRWLLSAAYFVPYVEYQPTESPWAIGVILNVPTILL